MKLRKEYTLKWLDNGKITTVTVLFPGDATPAEILKADLIVLAKAVQGGFILMHERLVPVPDVMDPHPCNN